MRYLYLSYKLKQDKLATREINNVRLHAPRGINTWMGQGENISFSTQLVKRAYLKLQCTCHSSINMGETFALLISNIGQAMSHFVASLARTIKRGWPKFGFR